MQATATPPGKLDAVQTTDKFIDTAQSVGTTVYDPNGVRTPGIWTTKNGSAILRIKEEMIGSDGIESYLEKIGVEPMGQPLCRIAEHPEHALDTNVRKVAREFGIELGQNPGTEVDLEDEESILTPGVWTHKASGMTVRITPQTIEDGFLGNLAPKGGLTVVLISLDYNYDSFKAIKRERRAWQPSARV